MRLYNQKMTIFRSFILLICFNSSLFGQEKSQSSLLDKQLTEIAKASNIPGFALSIIKNDTIIFSKGYGFANKKKKKPYSIETIQPIGSVSKTFIGFAIMKAIDQGYFTLETDINEILPFKIANPYYPNSPIKIRDLVTHTSGIIDNDTTYLKTYCEGEKPNMDLKDFLKEYFNSGGKFYSTANFDHSKAGEKYNYTNIGAALAAYLIEVKAKMSFADYTSKYLFAPLQMKHTHWFYDENESGNYATLYEVNKQELPLYQKIINKDGSLKTYSSVTYPDGNLKTSVSDLSYYLIAMMKGYFNQSDLLTHQSFETLFKKQFSENNMPVNMDPKEPNRAVFWAYNKKNKIIHTGSDPGVSAFISFDPTTKIGRILLINTQLEGDDNLKVVEYFRKIIFAMDNFETSIK